MATGKGVIQGYTGVAAVDGAYQIIVEAQAHGTGSEQEVLLPVVTAMLDRHGMPALLTPPSLITADAGSHREANLHALATRHGHALIADNAMRRRDERFATQGRHQALPDPRHHQSTSKAESKATTYTSGSNSGGPSATVCPALSVGNASARPSTPRPARSCSFTVGSPPSRHPRPPRRA